MRQPPITISIMPNSALGRTLRQAAAAQQWLIISSGTSRYRLQVQAQHTSETPTPAALRVHTAIRRAAGRWHGLVDTAALRRVRAARRQQGLRPAIQL